MTPLIPPGQNGGRRVNVTIEPEDTDCPAAGRPYVIGEETSQRLNVIPKYARRACEQAERLIKGRLPTEGWLPVRRRVSKACAPMPARGRRWFADRQSAAAIRAWNGLGRRRPRSVPGRRPAGASSTLTTSMVVSSSALKLRYDECLPAKSASSLPVSVGGSSAHSPRPAPLSLLDGGNDASLGSAPHNRTTERVAHAASDQRVTGQNMRSCSPSRP
jgi:hypothetical protein